MIITAIFLVALCFVAAVLLIEWRSHQRTMRLLREHRARFNPSPNIRRAILTRIQRDDLNKPSEPEP
jgi:hypothetical protein